MTEVFVGVVAVLPALLGYLNGRRRQLGLIQAEEEVLRGLPKDMTESRDAIRDEIAKSVAHYRNRSDRRMDVFLSWGATVGWVLLILGINLYGGSLTDPDAVRQFRLMAAVALIVVGGGTFLIVVALNGYKNFLQIQIWYYRRRTRKNEKIISEQKAKIDALMDGIASQRAGLEERIARLLEQESQIIAAGGTPLPRPEGIDRFVDEYVRTGSVAGLIPLDLSAIRSEEGDASSAGERSPDSA
jgi:hypothetical protein